MSRALSANSYTLLSVGSHGAPKLRAMNESTDPRELAAGKRRERETRIHRLRVRIAAGAVALFVAVWTGLFVQLAGGNDPALAGDAPPATQSADPDAASDDTTWADDSSPSDTSGMASETTQSTSSSPAAVTTGQS